MPKETFAYRETIFPDDVFMLNTSGTFHISGYYPKADQLFEKRSLNILEVIEKFPDGFLNQALVFLHKDDDDRTQF